MDGSFMEGSYIMTLRQVQEETQKKMKDLRWSASRIFGMMAY